MTSSIKYRPHIDGLRALAVLSVVIYHVIPSALPGGFLGVDIFFVISGYLITLIVLRELSSGTFRFADFYARRIRRLFPALATVLFATIAFGAFSLFADEYERLGKYASAAIVFLLNFRLMDEVGYFDVASDTKPLLHLWSLSVEEQFYLVWPALLVLLKRLRISIGWTVVVLIAGSFFFAVDLGARDVDALYFHPFARFWELLFGASLAYVHHRAGTHAFPTSLDRPVVHDALSVMGLAAIFVALLLWDKSTVHPGGFAIVPLLGVVALIASGHDALGNRLLALRPLVWVGLISYPLYLWHWPVLSYIRIVESGTPSPALLWGGAGLSVMLAAITYRFIEQPLRAPELKQSALIGLTGALAALLVASRVVVASDGLPDRSAVRYVKAAEAQLKREPRQDHSCSARFPAGNAPVYCRQENPGDRMIAIVGDSHAHVLFPGIATMAAERGFGTLLLANSGCPPFDGAVTGRNADEKERCANSIETIPGALVRDPRIESIFIASRGPQYIDGNGFGPAEATYNYPPISSRAGKDTPGNPAPAVVFRDGLARSVMRFHERGIPVAYILQVPELGVPARDCLRRPLTLMARNLGCEVARDVYRERMRDYRSLIDDLRASHPFLTVIDPESLFCDTAVCSGYRDGQLLYADDNHLSVLGSKRVAPVILDALLLGPSSRVLPANRAEALP